jgi:hypothetical protein
MERNTSSIKNKLSKYDLDEKILKKLLKHITNYQEYINVDPIKEIGDPISLNISIKFNYDDKNLM